MITIIAMITIMSTALIADMTTSTATTTTTSKHLLKARANTGPSEDEATSSARGNP